MDGEQSTVAGAPKQNVTLPSETVVPVDVKNVCEENRGIAPLILKLGTRSSRFGCFTLAITKRYVKRGTENPHVPADQPASSGPVFCCGSTFVARGGPRN
jgi:hypothetical protein